ncbi:MAG: hypothetical protein AAF328_01570, partial [Planctomycetota bacterium]
FGDAHRFEKISNIIKQFKLSCRKAQASFESMLLSTGNLTCLFSILSKDTTIMVIANDPLIYDAALHCNIADLRLRMS